jgi:hypothetical protein
MRKASYATVPLGDISTIGYSNNDVFLENVWVAFWVYICVKNNFKTLL